MAYIESLMTRIDRREGEEGPFSMIIIFRWSQDGRQSLSTMYQMGSSTKKAGQCAISSRCAMMIDHSTCMLMNLARSHVWRKLLMSNWRKIPMDDEDGPMKMWCMASYMQEKVTSCKELHFKVTLKTQKSFETTLYPFE